MAFPAGRDDVAQSVKTYCLDLLNRRRPDMSFKSAFFLILATC